MMPRSNGSGAGLGSATDSAAERGVAAWTPGALALAAVLSLLPACGSVGEPEGEPSAFSAEASKLQVRLRGVRFQRFAGESLEFEVAARRGVFEPERRVAQLSGVETYFRNAERGGDVQLSALQGDFDFDESRFVVRGEVEGRTATGDRFSTSEARYERGDATIAVDQPVTLRSGRVTSRGSGLRFDLASRQFTLFDIEGRREPTP